MRIPSHIVNLVHAGPLYALQQLHHFLFNTHSPCAHRIPSTIVILVHAGPLYALQQLHHFLFNTHLPIYTCVYQALS